MVCWLDHSGSQPFNYRDLLRSKCMYTGLMYNSTILIIPLTNNMSMKDICKHMNTIPGKILQKKEYMYFI